MIKTTFSMLAACALLATLGVTATTYAAGGDNQTKIQESLTSQGYSKWKRIELDKGVWEVDDAIDASGKQFDLRVDANSLKIISKEAE